MESNQLLRPVWAEVDLSAFRANVETVAGLVSSKTRVMPVIKANGYGIGATMAARATQGLPSVAGFAVATPEEAMGLRHDGIEAPVLVLGPVTIEGAAALAQAHVSITVASLHGLRDVRTVVADLGIGAKVHLKIETGMGRVGIMPGDELKRVIEEMRRDSAIELEGVFTHFSVADTDKDYTRRQFRVFDEAVDLLSRAGLKPVYRHASNSAAILDFPETHLDLVRPGILIYGSFPDRSLESKASVRPVLSLYARVSHVKTVPAGADIGYGRTYTTISPTTIATLPLGYADGYPRLLSGKGTVLIKGRRYKIAGRVCMDQMMIDVGDEKIQPGDLVTLIGTDGTETITLDDVAALAQTISHEILTGLTARVPRVYIS